MKILGLDHVTINLRDVEKSLWFYGELLALESLSTDKGRARHLAFEVDDARAIEEKLTKAGFPFHAPVKDIEKLGFAGGLTRDPNGFELEFLQYLGKKGAT